MLQMSPGAAAATSGASGSAATNQADTHAQPHSGAGATGSCNRSQGTPALVALHDAVGSWWTQTAASAAQQTEVVRAMAGAAARYMHVMWPQVRVEQCRLAHPVGELGSHPVVVLMGEGGGSVCLWPLGHVWGQRQGLGVELQPHCISPTTTTMQQQQQNTSCTLPRALAQVTHAPGLELTKLLLSGPLGAGWADRAFFSDDGSTAVRSGSFSLAAGLCLLCPRNFILPAGWTQRSCSTCTHPSLGLVLCPCAYAYIAFSSDTLASLCCPPWTPFALPWFL